jgi:serine/threonine-protein kinase
MFTGKRRASTQTNPTDLVKDLDPAVERVILHCIEQDPKLRPSSALRVAMALPGGDPMAAALAAGETPSPEMVAASAEKEGFSPRIAVLCFASLIASLIVLALFLYMGDLLTKAPINIPPEVLAFRAQEMLKEFGYNKRPRGIAYGFDCCDVSNLQYVYRQDLARRDEVLASDQPALVRFWYRQHQDRFFAGSVTLLASSDGTVRYDFPPNTEPGMVRIVLDARGRLIGLEARPAASGAGRPGSNVASFVWSSLFRHAGLDVSRFSMAIPRQIPSMAFDSRMAWVGTYAEGRPEQVRIEAALWEGKPVYFDVTGAWRVAGESIGDLPPQLTPVLAFLFVLIVGGGALVARHNLKLGQCDRKGASQLAAAYLLSAACSWMLTAAHMATFGEIGLMVSAIAVAAFPAAMLWLAYLAIEPYVRRHWPDSLISWTRFQRGRIRDPLVASHVLVGFLIITGVKACVLPIVFWGSPLPPQQFATASLSSSAYFAANLLGGSVRTALTIGVAFLLIVVLLRMLLRRVWIADMVGSFLLGLTSGGVSLSSPLRFTITALAIALGSYLILLLLRRFGLLAILAAWLAYSWTTVVPVSFTSWYAGRALVAYGTIVAAAAWALWVVVSQPRLDAEPAE